MDERSTVSRRNYLALLGAGITSVSGCLTDSESSPTGRNDRSTDAPTETATETSGTTIDDVATATDERTQVETDATTVEKAVSDAEASLAEISFEGAWFDTHAHWRMANEFGYDDYTTDAFTARQREHGVGATVLFVPHGPFRNDYQSTVETLARKTVDYLPFLFPGGFGSAERRQSYYDDTEAIYHGLGEVTFYSGREQGMALTDDPIPEYFQLSADEQLVLMLHPTEQQAGDLGQMLDAYPDATLLLHGFEMLGTNETLISLLRDHDNLYWTYDTATMLGGLMVTAEGKSDFIEQYEARKARYLERVTRKLPRLLDAAPERVMWGTDVVADWHVDPDVYGRLLSFSEDVRETLPTKHRDAFAYENAVALFDA